MQAFEEQAQAAHEAQEAEKEDKPAEVPDTFFNPFAND